MYHPARYVGKCILLIILNYSMQFILLWSHYLKKQLTRVPILYPLLSWLLPFKPVVGETVSAVLGFPTVLCSVWSPAHFLQHQHISVSPEPHVKWLFGHVWLRVTTFCYVMHMGYDPSSFGRPHSTFLIFVFVLLHAWWINFLTTVFFLNLLSGGYQYIYFNWLLLLLLFQTGSLDVAQGGLGLAILYLWSTHP